MPRLPPVTSAYFVGSVLFEEIFDGGDLPVFGRVVDELGYDAADVVVQLPGLGRQFCGALQIIRGLHQREHLDRQHLIAVFDHLTGQHRGVGAHADDILIVVVVGYRVHVHRIRKRLRFGRGRGRRELRRLQAVVEPQLAEVHERRQRLVDAVVEEVVQLPSWGPPPDCRPPN